MGVLTEVAVGILAEAVDGGWRVLIGKRPEGSVLGGYWEFPGGKREQGESLERCLIREVREELGLAVRVTTSLPAVDHHYDHASVRLFPFFCERVDRSEPQALAVSEWRWVKPTELADYTFPPANTELLHHVRYALRRPPRPELDELISGE